jgi:hypothetical protein
MKEINLPVIKNMYPMSMLDQIRDLDATPDDINGLRSLLPNLIAEKLVSVQPMDPNIFKDAYDAAMSEEDLIAQGYHPISDLKMMWIKDEEA